MFFFTSRRRHTMLQCDGSADVCSSDLGAGGGFGSVAGPVVATVFDFDLFQIRNPATPPPRRSTTKTAATINNPALLFDGAAGATCGISPVPFRICGTVATDGSGADSATVAAGILGGRLGAGTGGGGAGSKTVAAFVAAGRSACTDVGDAPSIVIIVGALTSDCVPESPRLIATVSISAGVWPLWGAGAESNAVRNSLPSIPAVACLSARSFAVARSIASLKARGTSGATSRNGFGVVATCSRRSSCNVFPEKQRRPRIIS